MLAKFLGYPKDEVNLNCYPTLASNNPFQDSLSENDAENRTPKVFAATSGPIVKETIDSGSPFSTLDSTRENEVLGESAEIIGWESIFAEIPQAILILDPQQNVLFSSNALAKLTGDDPAKVDGGIEAWFRLLCPNPDQAEKTISSWHEHVWRNQLTRIFDLNCKGATRQIEFKSSSAIDGQIVVTLVDVSEDQAANEALRQANFKFRSLFGNAPGGMVLVDEAGNIQEVNQAFTEFSKLASSDLVGKSFDSLLNAEDAEILSKAEQSDPEKIANRKRKIRFSFPNSETERPALVTPSYIFNENQKIIFSIYQLKPRDQHLMGKLKELSAKAQALLSAVPDMFVLVDQNGEIRDWSPPADQWEQSCLLDADAVGKPALEVWPEFGEFIEANADKVFSEKSTLRHQLKTNDEGLYQSSVTFAPFGDDLGLILVEKPAQIDSEVAVGGESAALQNQWHEHLFSASKTAWIVADTEGSLLESNPAAVSLFGQSERALSKSNLFRLLSKAPGTDELFDLDGFAEIEFEKTWVNLLSVSPNGPRSVAATVVPVRSENGRLESFVITIEPRKQVQADPLSDERDLAQSQFRSQLQIATSLFSITPESRDPETFNTWLMRLKVLAESMTTKKRVGVVHLMRDVADQVTSISGNGRGLREVVISGSSALTIENEAATTFALLLGEVMFMGVSSSGPDASGPSIYVDVEGYEGDIVLTAKPGEGRALFTSENKDNAKVIEILVEQLKGKIAVGVAKDENQPPSIRLAFPAPQT